jgi:hypothetical protein
MFLWTNECYKHCVIIHQFARNKVHVPLGGVHVVQNIQPYVKFVRDFLQMGLWKFLCKPINFLEISWKTLHWMTWDWFKFRSLHQINLFHDCKYDFNNLIISMTCTTWLNFNIHFSRIIHLIDCALAFF